MSILKKRYTFLSKLSVLLALLCFFTNILIAAPHVHYTVSPERGSIDTEFLVQVSITEDSTADSLFLDDAQPIFEDTKEISLKHISNAMQQQIINGAVSIQKTFIYKVNFNIALATGEYALPKGFITINNSKYRLPTKSIFIDQIPGSSNSQNPAQTAKQIDGFQFVQTVSNENPYVGEQISYKVEIIAPDNLEKAELEEFEPQGIWRERYGKDEKKVRRVQNIRINSFSESWFPVHSGEITVPDRTLAAEVREFQRKRALHFNLGQNLGEQLLGSLMPYLNQYRSVEKKIKTAGFKIKVKPLPPAPASVKGYIPVGQLKVTSSIDSNQVQVGEPVTLTIQVSGDANIRPLEIETPPSLNKTILKRYDAKPILSKTIGDSNVAFYKTFKISLTPLKSGTLTLPEFSLHWFNPVKEEYQTYKTKDFTIKVTGDTIINPEDTNENTLTSEDAQESNNVESKKTYTDEELSILAKRIPALSRSQSLYVYMFLLLIPLIQYFFSFLKFKINNKSSKSQKPIKILKEKLIQAHDSTPLEHISHTVKNILSEKYKMTNQSHTTEEIRHLLQNYSSDSLYQYSLELLGSIDRATFAGENVNTDEILSLAKKIATHV